MSRYQGLLFLTLYPVLVTPVPDHDPLILHPIRYLIVIPIILGGCGLPCLVLVLHTSEVLCPDHVAGDGLYSYPEPQNRP